MRQFFFFSFLLASLVGSAQFIEFGGGIGTMHYTGDLNSTPRLGLSRLGGNVTYKLNFSEIVTFRLNLTAGRILGNDENPVDVLGENRNHSFDHNIWEFSGSFEYHFLEYRSSKIRNKFSPYATLGFGLARISNTEIAYEDYNKVQPVIPMGGGIKYMIGKRWTLAAELGARKTFFDYLDGISDGDQTLKNYRYGNPNDQDWFFYSSINLTYVLYNIPCPFPYVPNRSILMRIRAN